jgi:hypothetical protein
MFHLEQRGTQPEPAMGEPPSTKTALSVGRIDRPHLPKSALDQSRM